MRRLMAANLRRLWRNPAFLITVVGMAVTMLLNCMTALRNGPVPVDNLLFLSLMHIGVLIAIFISIFVGTEYSDGAMRNKIIVGHKRRDIYLANLLTGMIGATILYLIEIVIAVAIGLAMSLDNINSIQELVTSGIFVWLATLVYAALFTIVGMLISSKSTASITNVLMAFVLMFFGMAIYSSGYEKGSIWELFLELNPIGQTIFAIQAYPDPIKLMAYSLALIIVLTGAGLFGFSRKDLK